MKKELLKLYDFEKMSDRRIYHNAKLILKIYPDVLWQIREEINDYTSESIEMLKCNLSDSLAILEEFEGYIEQEKLENRLRGMSFSKSIIELVNKAVVMVKNYPKYGELYYRILDETYLRHYKLDESYILESLEMSRTTYYKYKKKAINLFGVVLWGFALPQLIESIQNISETESADFLRT